MTDATNVANRADQPTVEVWLRRLGERFQPSKAIHEVLQAVIQQPELATYASGTEIAAAAKVNVATVVRAAQTFGFSGWPEWRQEIRARYLNELTAQELAVVHESINQHPLDVTLSKALDQLATIRRNLDRKIITDFAKAMAGANRRLIIAPGSFAAVGRALAHHAGIAGYRCELLDDGFVLANALADLTDRDIVIPITVWRLYNASIAAAREARRRGTRVYLISDQIHSPIAELADRVLVVPSEGTSFFPTVVPSMCVVESLCAQLARVNPEHSAKAIAAAEKQWQDFNLLHFNKTGPA